MIKREYYSLNDAARMIGCSIDDLLYIGVTGKVIIIALTSGMAGIRFNKDRKVLSENCQIEPILSDYCIVPKTCLKEVESIIARGQKNIIIGSLDAPDNSGDHWDIQRKYGIPISGSSYGSSLFLLTEDIDTLILTKINQQTFASEKPSAPLTAVNSKPFSNMEWIPHAKTIGKRIYHENPPHIPRLSVVNICKKVEAEMARRHSAGESGMTGRGGKPLSAENIRRRAINFSDLIAKK